MKIDTTRVGDRVRSSIMASRIKSLDPLDLLVVKIIHEPQMGPGVDRWRIIYASGRETISTDADHVQSIMSTEQHGNRRTLR